MSLRRWTPDLRSLCDELPGLRLGDLTAERATLPANPDSRRNGSGPASVDLRVIPTVHGTRAFGASTQEGAVAFQPRSNAEGGLESPPLSSAAVLSALRMTPAIQINTL